MTANNSIPRIAVDAMGGDHGPEVIVPGAIEALKEIGGFELVFYGDESAVNKALESQGDLTGLSVSIVHCTQNIEMCDSPAGAIRGKPDSPIVRAMKDQKAAEVSAVVSAGSTGAMVASSLLIMGRLPSVSRPCIATLAPTVNGEFLLLDAGANSTCSMAHLVRFAEMGNLYCREMREVKSPRIGLLNIGEEETKGTDILVETNKALRGADLNFVGNVEGNETLLGVADVVVTDGFTGNIILKQIEGFGRFMLELSQSSKLPDGDRDALLPALGVLKKCFNYELYGGAPLLGIDGVSIICHGRSSSLAIVNAVRNALRQVVLGIPQMLRNLPTCID